MMAGVKVACVAKNWLKESAAKAIFKLEKRNGCAVSLNR